MEGFFLLCAKKMDIKNEAPEAELDRPIILECTIINNAANIILMVFISVM